MPSLWKALDKRRAAQEMKRVLLPILLLVFATSVGGCAEVGSLDDMIPQPPSPPSLPPKIHNLKISPATIPANQTTTVTFRFEYEDINGDVGPDTANVLLEYSSSDPLVSINPSLIIVTAEVHWADSRGTQGAIEFQRLLGTRGGNINTSVRAEIRLRDRDGNESNRLLGRLSIVGARQQLNDRIDLNDPTMMRRTQ